MQLLSFNDIRRCSYLSGSEGGRFDSMSSGIPAMPFFLFRPARYDLCNNNGQTPCLRETKRVQSRFLQTTPIGAFWKGLATL